MGYPTGRIAGVWTASVTRYAYLSCQPSRRRLDNLRTLRPVPGDSSRFRAPNSEWGNSGVVDSSPRPLSRIAKRVEKVRNPILAKIPRDLLEDAWLALDGLVHAAAGRRNFDRFQLAVEEGARVLALGPRVKPRG